MKYKEKIVEIDSEWHKAYEKYNRAYNKWLKVKVDYKKAYAVWAKIDSKRKAIINLQNQ